MAAPRPEEDSARIAGVPAALIPFAGLGKEEAMRELSQLAALVSAYLSKGLEISASAVLESTDPASATALPTLLTRGSLLRWSSA